MPEPAPPDVAALDARRPAQALSPAEIDGVLADFRSWLTALAEAPAGPANGAPSPQEAPDLHTLLGQFLALRHEVNLQTRAARNQQEQNAETLRQLGAALESLRAAQAQIQQSQDERLRPLLETLVGLHDALARAGREVGRSEDALAPLLEQACAVLEEQAEAPAAALPARELPRSFLARLFGTAAHEVPQRPEDDDARDRAQEACEGLERVQKALASLVVGYGMSLQRIERALARHGLEPILSVGRPFDPERMEVVEAVSGSGRPAGEVLQEVRRGYLYNGRVFRFAQVRVAKGDQQAKGDDPWNPS
jgi:molecular chaperone GrpE